MQLTRAFGIKDKDVVSLVGGGGKTTAMFRIADELVANGKRVVTTTTTRIFAAQIKLAPFHIFTENYEQVIRDLRLALRDHAHVLVIGTTTGEGKALGVEPSLVDQIITFDEVDVIINEADGSRMRPFKAPNQTEPVIPNSTTLLVPVVGIDAIGAPLDDEHVHRAERVAALAGVKTGATVQPEIVARVIAHPDGGLKNRPSRARVIPLVNKVESDAQLRIAREIARQLLKTDAIEAVAIGSVKNATLPIAELQQRVAAVILAAGGATRMRGPLKQLLPWGNSTLLGHTLDVVSRSQVAEMIVVVGRQADDVKKELKELGAAVRRGAGRRREEIRIVENWDWASGRASSVRVGLNAVRKTFAAAIFVNADQPFLTPKVIDTILQHHAQASAPMVVPLYHGKRGSPVLFARELFPELMQLQGDLGGREILLARRAEVQEVNIPDVRAAIDLDTPEQYQAALSEAELIPPEETFMTAQSKEPM